MIQFAGNVVPKERIKVLEEKFLSFFKPKPIPVDLMRVGGNCDGAYLVPKDLMGVDACFSPGVATYKTFEDELALVYGIKSHMVDFSVEIEEFDSPLIRGMQTFSPLWLRAESSWDSISLGDWIANNEANATGDFLLQMDIEGGEYQVIESVASEVLDRFRILVIEFHDVRSGLLSRLEEAPIMQVIDRLSPGFVVAHVHPNNCEDLARLPGGIALIPEVMEVTLLRRDRLGEEWIPDSANKLRIPHPLDIGRNAPHRPPVFLDASWSNFGVWFRSFPRMVREHLQFLMSVRKRSLIRRIRRTAKAKIDGLYLRLVYRGWMQGGS